MKDKKGPIIREDLIKTSRINRSVFSVLRMIKIKKSKFGSLHVENYDCQKLSNFHDILKVANTLLIFLRFLCKLFYDLSDFPQLF